MSIAGRRADRLDTLRRGASRYVDQLGLRDGAYCTESDLAQAFLAGCAYVEAERFAREIIAATYADETIEIRFGDKTTVRLTPTQLNLPPELVSGVDFSPHFLEVQFTEPHQLHPKLDVAPQKGASYSANWLRSWGRSTVTKTGQLATTSESDEGEGS